MSYTVTIESRKQIPPGHPDELQRLRDRVEELEEVIGLSEASSQAFRRCKLAPSPATIVNMLYRRNHPLLRSQIFRALYGARLESDQPEEERIIDVHLSRVRTWLKSLGIKVQNTYGGGWWLLAADKEKIRLELERNA